MVERRGAQLDEHFTVGGLGIRGVLVAENLGAAVLMYANRLHGQNPRMTADDVRRLAERLGIDAVGVTRAEAYDGTERHINERRARGLFADMRFTMTRPEESCHPERLLPAARCVVSAALCYWRPEAPLQAGRGRLARYTREDAYALLRERLDALGRELGGAYRVLVDANQHVDREAAARSGVGFYGKNTMLITRRHGSWVVLGTLITDVTLESTPPLDTDCGVLHVCASRRARPVRSTSPARSTRRAACRTGRRRPHPIPVEMRAELGAQVYGCDICQDVCPWNRGVEGRRSRPARATRRTSISSRGSSATGGSSWPSSTASTCRETIHAGCAETPLVALGNVGGPEHVPALELAAAHDDALVAEHATWALARIAERHT